MRWLLSIMAVVLSTTLLGSPDARKDAELNRIKAAFPAHLAAGGKVEAMHPVARECFESIAAKVAELNLANLPKQTVRLASWVEVELSTNTRAASDGDNPFGSRGRAAAGQNARWLDTKVKPWLKRLAEISRAKE
jgi:hypothetical protein